MTLGTDVKGDNHEGLLERNAEDTKTGADQDFTPRTLIRAMVECARPEPGKTIADPALGTGGFFLAAHDFLTDPDTHALDKDKKAFLKHSALFGNEIVAGTRCCRAGIALHPQVIHRLAVVQGGICYVVTARTSLCLRSTFPCFLWLKAILEAIAAGHSQSGIDDTAVLELPTVKMKSNVLPIYRIR